MTVGRTGGLVVHQPEIDYMQESVTIGLNIVDSNTTIC